MTANWARTGMKEDTRILMALYRESLPPIAREVLLTEEERRASLNRDYFDSVANLVESK